MFGGPTLAPEGRTFEELAGAGWSEADMHWENTAEAGLQCLAEGDRETARTEFAHAVRIATANFVDPDPRLGNSLANHGAALVEFGDAHLSGRTVSDALRIWQSCDAWVARMTAPRVARSSLFHLRMELRHRATYEARWRVKWGELVEEARSEVIGDGRLALVSEAGAGQRLARWQRERPAMLNDTRKLMAAVLLLACRRDDVNPLPEGEGARKAGG